MEFAELNETNYSGVSKTASGECEPMYVRYAKEFHVSEHFCESESRLLRRINRFIVYYFGAYLCYLDLEASRCCQLVDSKQLNVLNNWQLSSSSSSSRETKIIVKLATGDTCDDHDNEFLDKRNKCLAHSWWQHINSLVRQQLRGLKQSKWKRQLRVNWITQMLLASFCVCEVYLLITVNYQYRYDFDVLRLRELQRRQTSGGAGDGDGPSEATQNVIRVQQLAQVVKSRLDATKIELDWLGSDCSHMTILAGCFYMCIIPLTFLMHLPIYLHHRYQRPFDQCHIVRDLLDQGRENELNERMVNSQIVKFLESSRVYHANLSNLSSTPLGIWQAGAKLALDSFAKTVREVKASCTSGATSCHLRPLSGPDGLVGVEIDQMVREMLASGALVPLYKLRSWICRRTLMQFGHHVCLASYTIAFYLALNWGFYSLVNHELPPNYPRSRPSPVRIACLGSLIISSPSVALHPPLTMMVVREQIHYIRELRRMIAQCIGQNYYITNQIRLRNKLSQVSQSGRQVKISTLTNQDNYQNNYQNNNNKGIINSNLVFVLLHYKIFVAQLTPMLLTLGILFVIALAVLFTVPIIVRLHIPYLRQLYEDRLTDTQIRIFAVVISASVVVPINMLTMPLCHMFAQCECLYRDLFSLMAHISEIKSWSGCANLYDNHAQSCLLKELSDSNRLLRQLTARAGPITGTYTTLVRALFWYGLLLISIMADNSYSGTGNRELLSSLFSDPLGVNFLKDLALKRRMDELNTETFETPLGGVVIALPDATARLVVVTDATV